jgi:hypothetical protein
VDPQGRELIRLCAGWDSTLYGSSEDGRTRQAAAKGCWPSAVNPNAPSTALIADDYSIRISAGAGKTWP